MISSPVINICITLFFTFGLSFTSVLLWKKLSDTQSTTLFPVALFTTIASSTGFIMSFYFGYTICKTMLIKKQNRIDLSHVDYNTL